MKRLLALFTLLLSSVAFPVIPAFAESEIFLCDDGHGSKEYKNTGATKGCKKIDLPGITTIPGLPRKPATLTASARSSSLSTQTSSSPSDFPRVDSTVQKTRDNDRKQILQDEMRTEEQKLSDLRKEFNNGEPERRGDERNYAKYQERVATLKNELTRTEKNIDALKRELSNLR
ncbi:MAG: hypothetical protein NVSMB6_16390 [Burkholderiaceae bacterium]